jgi:hypothetical protein
MGGKDRVAQAVKRGLMTVLREDALQLLDDWPFDEISVSRRRSSWRPFPLPFPLMPDPPVTPTRSSTTKIRR